MNRVRTALIGCGKVGQIQAEALSALPESDFVAVCDSDPARAQAFATRYRGRPYTDVPTMIKECAVCVGLHLHSAPAARPAGDRGGQGRGPRPGRKAARGKPRGLRRDDSRGATERGQAWSHQPAAMV